MPAPLQRWTRARVLALPRDGRRYELVGHELLVTPAPSDRHQVVVARLLRELGAHADRHRLGTALASPADLRFPGADLLQPDVFVLPAPWRPTGDWLRAPLPILVVEVVSPGSRREDLLTRRRICQAAGVPEYWAVDLVHLQVERSRPGDEQPEVQHTAIRWQPRADVPALEVDLMALFGEVRE